jgi:hypothetical protein
MRLDVAALNISSVDDDVRHIFALVFCALCSASNIVWAGGAPTPDQVQTWWKASSTEELTIEGPMQEVHLVDKEVAFIAPVGFYGRGRNSIWHAVLVRPAIEQVREVPFPVGNQNISVRDIDEDGVSEVTSESVGSGQGTTQRIRSIVRFNGFFPIVMHAVEEEDNLGACGDGEECEAVSVRWEFGRQSTTGSTTLTETVTTSKGPRQDRMKGRRQIRRYVLLENIFVRADARDLRYPDEVGSGGARPSE